jgi:hypothetical protein
MKLWKVEQLSIDNSKGLVKERLSETWNFLYFVSQVESINFKKLLKGWNHLYKDAYDQFFEEFCDVDDGSFK